MVDLNRNGIDNRHRPGICTQMFIDIMCYTHFNIFEQFLSRIQRWKENMINFDKNKNYCLIGSIIVSFHGGPLHGQKCFI